MSKLNNRADIIIALKNEFNHNPIGFNTNQSTIKFWTFNRLFHFYWDIKHGRKERYKTKYNPSTGFYELKADY